MSRGNRGNRQPYKRCGCGKGGEHTCKHCNPPTPPATTPKPKDPPVTHPTAPKCSCGCNQLAQNCPNR